MIKRDCNCKHGCPACITTSEMKKMRADAINDLLEDDPDESTPEPKLVVKTSQ